MANPSKRKGTGFEVELLPLLRQVFGPQVERAPLKGIHDAGDFVGVPFPVEAKCRKVFSLRQWVSKLRRLGPAWAIAYKDDARMTDAAGRVLVLPLELGLEALLAWREKNHVTELMLRHFDEANRSCPDIAGRDL